jgi:hypothetical protein
MKETQGRIVNLISSWSKRKEKERKKKKKIKYSIYQTHDVQTLAHG